MLTGNSGHLLKPYEEVPHAGARRQQGALANLVTGSQTRLPSIVLVSPAFQWEQSPGNVLLGGSSIMSISWSSP